MRWTPGGSDKHIEDRRGQRGGGGGFGLPIGRMGIGGFLVLLVLSFIFKTDLFSLLGGGGVAPVTQQAPVPPEQDKMYQMVKAVHNDVQSTWQQQFSASGQTYQPATLVVFTDSTTTSGCGYGQAAMGPFYCPADQKAYIDLGFYQDLKDRFGAPGDFAQAYVLAHEIGHHVQHLLGIDQMVRQAQERNPREVNELSVKMELQADCLAGVWGHQASKRRSEAEGIILDPGDVEEALTAAASIGDDRIQGQSGRGSNPESWTHGSSQQRVEWFRVGMETGDPNRCDTFGGAMSGR